MISVLAVPKSMAMSSVKKSKKAHGKDVKLLGLS